MCNTCTCSTPNPLGSIIFDIFLLACSNYCLSVPVHVCGLDSDGCVPGDLISMCRFSSVCTVHVYNYAHVHLHVRVYIHTQQECTCTCMHTHVHVYVHERSYYMYMR